MDSNHRKAIEGGCSLSQETLFSKLDRTISKVGVLFGLSLALVAILPASGVALLILQYVEKENRASIQQAIGDTTQELTIHFTSEVAHFMDHIASAAKNQLDAIAVNAGQPNDAPGAKAPRVIGQIETHAEILDISLWKRGTPTTTFDLDPIPKRMAIGLNVKSPLVNSRSADPLVEQIEAATESEIVPLQAAFHGHEQIILESSVFGNEGGIFMIVPLEEGPSPERVALAHIRSEQFLKAVETHGMVTPALVDDFGNSLPRNILDGAGNSMSLYNRLRQSKVGSGQSVFQAENGQQHWGGFRRIDHGRLGVLATLPASEAGSILNILGHQTALVLLVSFFLFLGIGYRVPTQTFPHWFGGGRVASGRMETDLKGSNVTLSVPEPGVSALDGPSSEPGLEGAAKVEKKWVAVIHGSFKFVNRIMETQPADDVVRSLNDFYSLAEGAVQDAGGWFIRMGMTSFIGIWPEDESDPNSGESAAMKAVRGAMTVRKTFSHHNQTRKTEGQKPIIFGMGVDGGVALLAKTGPENSTSRGLIGVVVDCARALDHLVLRSKSDLLVSQEIWSKVGTTYLGDRQGEARLTGNTGLTGYYTLTGYKEENGETVNVESNFQPYWQEMLDRAPEEDAPESTHAIAIDEKKSNRWLVNNGSQIIGPFTPSEIGEMLFAQELDFDCECWSEGTGISSSIRSAGMFEGADDPGADLWIYDGKTVHGPINQGFLKTAIGHGAVKMESTLICQSSTVTGWKTIEAWDPQFLKNIAGTAAPASTPDQRENNGGAST